MLFNNDFYAICPMPKVKKKSWNFRITKAVTFFLISHCDLSNYGLVADFDREKIEAVKNIAELIQIVIGDPAI